MFNGLLSLTLCCGIAFGQPAADPAASGDVGWLQFGGEPTATRSSPLDQITSENIGNLRIAWATELGFTGRVQGSPAAWQGRLFVSTEDGVLSLDGTVVTALWHITETSGHRTTTA